MIPLQRKVELRRLALANSSGDFNRILNSVKETNLIVPGSEEAYYYHGCLDGISAGLHLASNDRGLLTGMDAYHEASVRG